MIGAIFAQGAEQGVPRPLWWNPQTPLPWRDLGQLPGREGTGVGVLMPEEEFTRELEKGVPSRGNSLCHHSGQERARCVRSHSRGSVGL